MNKKLIIFCLALAIAVLSLPVYADTVVIGNWEQSPDNSIDWGNKLSVADPCNMPTKTTGKAGYQYDQAVGVTLNSNSLEVTQSGWGQSLALRLDAAQRAAFITHDTFSIDMSVAAQGGDSTAPGSGGYSQIYELAMNAAGPGFKAVATGNPINFYWWTGSGARTQTLNVNYTTFRNAIQGMNYIEIIFALNTGGGAPPEMYFDNARLSGVPEPATVALLGLGGLALLRRKQA